MQGRLDCIQTLLANPYLMRLVGSRVYIYTHRALFAHYNTMALNAEAIGALHTLERKAIKSESCIRKKTSSLSFSDQLCCLGTKYRSSFLLLARSL